MTDSHDGTHDSPLTPHSLCGPDAQAMEALLASGMNASRVPEELRERALRVGRLLNLIDAGRVAPAPSLIDVTLARVSRAGVRRAGQARNAPDDLMPDAVLTADSTESLDAYVESGFRLSSVPGELRDRAEVVERMTAIITRHSSAAPGAQPGVNLVEATLARVQATPRTRRRPSAAEVFRPSGGFSLRDIVSVAAVLLIGAAVLWPVLSAVRTHQMRTNCIANLGTVASAMSTYAGDYTGSLPMATASLAGSRWWDVGQSPARSNSANLFTLPRLGYAPVNALACPGNERASACRVSSEAEDWSCIDDVSYSYYVMFGNARPTWERSSDTVVLADRSPVILRAVRGQRIYDMENSPNHAGRGQWALRTDGSALWMHTPMAGDDNIWLPASVEYGLREARRFARDRQDSGRPLKPGEVIRVEIRGDELPASESDSFVAP